MNAIDMNVNMVILREMGLDVDSTGTVYDQDTGHVLNVNGMRIVAPGLEGIKGESVEFDPYNNRKLMDLLFGYFINKYSKETDIDMLTYYGVENGDGRGFIVCVMSDNSELRSGVYMRECLKLVDIIILLNGGEANSLHEFDTPIIIKEPVNSREGRGGAKRGTSTRRTNS